MEIEANVNVKKKKSFLKKIKGLMCQEI